MAITMAATNERRRRIGLLGGSFDPPHAGHIALAKAAREALGLDLVRFIPSAASPSPTKPSAVASGGQRLAMVRLAAEDNEVSSIEIDRKGRSYTIDTIREFNDHEPDAEFMFLVGSDRALTVPRWRGIDEMRGLCRFAAAIRSGAEADLPDWIERFMMPEIDLSSTMVRERLRQRLPVDAMVAPGVLDFIRSEGLYA
jgi:nicotinate-nucleotide adenylyltransferase